MFSLSSLQKGDFYAGIGSRETPPEIQAVMTDIARSLKGEGIILRSGGAGGADTAFEKGAGSLKEIYLPWKGFDGGKSTLYSYNDRHGEIARRFHPAWHRLSQGAQKMMIRNSAQIFGLDFLTRSSCVIAWTKDGQASGGTGQAIRIAQAYGVPVLNLYFQEIVNELRGLL
jgi:hypothetical protein